MKFERLVMHNFMRYKGTNEIRFSCSDTKNVTVILGDNTTGKTTIAQAFRWCLYGALLTEQGKKEGDYALLNNDILAGMDANSRAGVFVELTAADEEKRYQIRREAEYTRLFPKMLAKETSGKQSMQIAQAEDPDIVAEVAEEKVQELVNELFPKNLSHYFLFDGERWSDIRVDGMKESIKDSVHILTGLSSYQKAMWHLKDMGSNSVIRKFKSKISGSGSIYDSLKQDAGRMERQMEDCREQIKNLDINIMNCQKQCEKIEQYLEENKSTEAMQNQYRQLGIVQKARREQAENNYKMLAGQFARKTFMVFAEPMIRASLNMMAAVEGERRDIPHMRQATIDHIIKNGKCICGTLILPGSQALENLMKQRNYLPPADIGSLLGEFERTASRWRNQSRNTGQELKELAEQTDQATKEYEETCNQRAGLEHRMEEHVDFAEKRKRLRGYQEEMRRLSMEKGSLQGRMESCRRQKENIEHEMKAQEAKSAENEKWSRRKDLAETLYKKMQEDFSRQEANIFQELNQQIQYNFSRMFNAKDKKLQLTKQYEIEMLYQTEVGYREEKNLSEGEKIARNFAFIVTIMEYSRRKKAEKQGTGQENDTLPIVLDGPFSKLGDENIGLIAKILPEVSEQVILFMLKKDWKYTNLDEFVGASYLIRKDADKSYASIAKLEGGIA